MKSRFIALLGALALILAPVLAACGSGSGGSNSGSSAAGDSTTQAQPTGEAAPTPVEIRSGSFRCTSIDVSTAEAREPLGFGGGVKYENVGGTACTGDESKMPRSRSCLNPSGALNRDKPDCLPPLWVCDSGVGGWSAGGDAFAPARNNLALRGYFCNPYTHT